MTLWLLIVSTITVTFTNACKTAQDCSYLGQCNTTTSKCICNNGWFGDTCNSINISSKIDYTTDGYHDSTGLATWDGSPIKDPKTNLYHLYISVLTDNCTPSSTLSPYSQTP